MAHACCHLGDRQNVLAGTVHVEEEIVLEDGDLEDGNDSQSAVAAEEESNVDMELNVADDGRNIHDDVVVKKIWGQAIRTMQDQGVVIDAEK